LSTVSSLCPHCHAPVILYRDDAPVFHPRWCQVCGHNPRKDRTSCDCPACNPSRQPDLQVIPLEYDR